MHVMPRSQQLLYNTAQVTFDILILIHTGSTRYSQIFYTNALLSFCTVIAVALRLRCFCCSNHIAIIIIVFCHSYINAFSSCSLDRSYEEVQICICFCGMRDDNDNRRVKLPDTMVNIC